MTDPRIEVSFFVDLQPEKTRTTQTINEYLICIIIMFRKLIQFPLKRISVISRSGSFSKWFGAQRTRRTTKNTKKYNDAALCTLCNLCVLCATFFKLNHYHKSLYICNWNVYFKFTVPGAQLFTKQYCICLLENLPIYIDLQVSYSSFCLFQL